RSLGCWTRRRRDDRDERGAAVRELVLLLLGNSGPLHLRFVVSSQRIRKLLAAIRSGAGLVTLREWRLVHGSGVRLDVHRGATVGLAALSLWRLGIRPVFWMDVVAGIWIWLWGSGIPTSYGSFHPLENGVDWAGAGASLGCARQRTDQPGKGGLSGCRRNGCAESHGKRD